MLYILQVTLRFSQSGDIVTLQDLIDMAEHARLDTGNREYGPVDVPVVIDKACEQEHRRHHALSPLPDKLIDNLLRNLPFLAFLPVIGETQRGNPVIRAPLTEALVLVKGFNVPVLL